MFCLKWSRHFGSLVQHVPVKPTHEIIPRDMQGLTTMVRPLWSLPPELPEIYSGRLGAVICAKAERPSAEDSLSVSKSVSQESLQAPRIAFAVAPSSVQPPPEGGQRRGPLGIHIVLRNPGMERLVPDETTELYVVISSRSWLRLDRDVGLAICHTPTRTRCIRLYRLVASSFLISTRGLPSELRVLLVGRGGLKTTL